MVMPFRHRCPTFLAVHRHQRGGQRATRPGNAIKHEHAGYVLARDKDTRAQGSCIAISLAQVDTEFSADCIEWCPFAGFQDLFVCGTYQVLEPHTASSEVEQEEAVKPDADADVPDDSDDEVDTSDAPKKQTQRTGRLLLFQVDPDSGAV